jgi:glycerate-2-kinase
MGIDKFTTDSSSTESQTDNEDDDTDSRPNKQKALTTREVIAVNIREHAESEHLGVEMVGDELRGDVEDVAMLFALMTMDFQKSDFDKLIQDDLD